MSKWIDADALEYDTEWSEYHDGFTAYSQMAIDTAPSIDIVRCKECKHHSYDSCTRICDEYGLWDEVTDNDFCSKGERSE